MERRYPAVGVRGSIFYIVDMGMETECRQYLHSDLQWRSSASSGFQFTGHYSSRESAEKTIEKWRAANGGSQQSDFSCQFGQLEQERNELQDKLAKATEHHERCMETMNRKVTEAVTLAELNIGHAANWRGRYWKLLKDGQRTANQGHNAAVAVCKALGIDKNSTLDEVLEEIAEIRRADEAFFSAIQQYIDGCEEDDAESDD